MELLILKEILRDIEPFRHKTRRWQTKRKMDEGTSWLVAWLSGNALVSINVVTLHQARLVLGWVTVCERVNHLGM